MKYMEIDSIREEIDEILQEVNETLKGINATQPRIMAWSLWFSNILPFWRSLNPSIILTTMERPKGCGDSAEAQTTRNLSLPDLCSTLISKKYSKIVYYRAAVYYCADRKMYFFVYCIVYCVLCIVYCILCIVYCLLFIVNCVLCWHNNKHT